MRLWTVFCWLLGHREEAARGGWRCGRCGQRWTYAEWVEELAYQSYMRTTLMGRDFETWRRLGCPERDESAAL